MKFLCTLMVLGCHSIWLLTAADSINNQVAVAASITKNPTTPNPISTGNATTATPEHSTNGTTTEHNNNNNNNDNSTTSTIKHPPSDDATSGPPINQYDQNHKMMLVLMSDVKLREYGKSQLGSATAANGKNGKKQPGKGDKEHEECAITTTAAPTDEGSESETNCASSSTTPAPGDMNCDESRRDEQIIEAKIIRFSEPIACETLSKDEPSLHHAHDVNCYFPAFNPVWFRMCKKRARNQRRNLRLKELFASYRKPKPYMYDYDYMDHYDEGPWRSYDSKEDAFYSAL